MPLIEIGESVGRNGLGGISGAQVWKPLRLAGGAVKQAAGCMGLQFRGKAEGTTLGVSRIWIVFKAMKLDEMLLSKRAHR